MKPQFTSETLRTKSLKSDLKVRMFALFERYYRDVTESMFLEDLSDKDYVMLFWRVDGERALIGFSTISLKRGLHGVLTVFSGDTVVDEAYWGSHILQKSFSRFLAITKFRHPREKVYWMLMSKGYKTYLLMRRNLPMSFPNPKNEGSAVVTRIKDDFYHRKYGEAYHPKTSLIQFDTPHGAVKGEIAVPSAETLAKDAEVAFFIKRNPNYAKGDEFACIAEIRLRDLAYILSKYVFSRKKKKKVKS